MKLLGIIGVISVFGLFNAYRLPGRVVAITITIATTVGTAAYSRQSHRRIVV